MVRVRDFRVILAIVLALAFGLSTAADQPTSDLQPIPPLTQRVTDLAGLLSSTQRQQLETKLASWEGRTGTQLAVLLVPSTQPEAIEQYSIRVVEAWKLGKKGQDNGLLLLVAKNDKKIRIEVGYGLEGNIPDVTAKRVISEVITPEFKAGNFYGGIDAAIDKLEGLAAGTDQMPPPARSSAAPRGGSWDWGSIVPFVFFGMLAFAGVLRRIFGTLFGGLAGGGIATVAAWFISSSLVIGLGIGVVVAIILFLTMGLGSSSGRGVWLPGVGMGGMGGGSGGGGSWSGGGGGFGGGGASGNW